MSLLVYQPWFKLVRGDCIGMISSYSHFGYQPDNLVAWAGYYCSHGMPSIRLADIYLTARFTDNLELKSR